MARIRHGIYPEEAHLIEQFVTVTNGNLPPHSSQTLCGCRLELLRSHQNMNTLLKQCIPGTQEPLEHVIALHRSGQWQ